MATSEGLHTPGTVTRVWNRRDASGVHSLARFAMGACLLIVPGFLSALNNGALAQSTSIELEEVFRLGESYDGLLFGDIASIASDARGRIYVTDYQNPVVQVLSEAGELISTIGGPGEGPGEFGYVEEVVVGPDNRVFVWDGWLARVSVFEEGSIGEFEISETIPVEGYDGLVPYALIGAVTDGMVFLYSTPYGFCDECRNTGPRSLSAMLVNKNGQVVGESLVTLPDNERIELLTADGITVLPKPFGNTSRFTMSPAGDLYSGWSDAIRIHAQALRGDWQKTFERAYAPLPVAQRELDTAIEGWNRAEREALRKSGMPRTRPIFKNFGVDDKNRIWVQASAAIGSTTAECIIIGPDGADVAAIVLPSGFTLESIRGGRAVGVLKEESSGPIIVAYRVIE